MASPLQRPDDNVVNSLSRDQRLLLEIVTAVSSGNWSDDKFAYAKIGQASSARWLTLAARILAFYIRTDNPTEELCRIVDFIQKVYAPAWFRIKIHNNFLEGPRIIFEILENARALNDQQCLNIVIDKIQHWAFPLQAENFLACMLYSPRTTQLERMMAAYQIMDVRVANNRHTQSSRPTSSSIPPVNKEAQKWTNLIQLSQANHEPPITTQLEPEKVKNPNYCKCFYFKDQQNQVLDNFSPNLTKITAQ